MNVEVIKTIRRMSNLDQIEFSEKVGISFSLVGKIESGNASLTKRTVSKIMHAFRLTEQDIADLESVVEHLKKEQ